MIMGVFISHRIFSHLAKGVYYPGLQLLAEEAIPERVIVVAFSPPCVDCSDNSINGLSYSLIEKTWRPGKYPFPDVIYDRATFRQQEKLVGNLVRKIFKEEYKIPFLNSKHSFGKWETHRTFSAYSEIKKYLPDTVLYRHPLHLVDFLGKYKTVYIKASGGSLGRDIFKVQQAYEGIYIITYREKGKNHSVRLNMQGFKSRVIKGKLAGKTVLIQQGIELAALEGSPFDIRLLVQKNGSGSWEVVDKAIRLAAPGSVVTNVSSGGKVKKLNQVVPLVFPDSVSTINQDIDVLALNACRCLEEKYGRLGELGIDMALDVNGRLWVLEVNGKPAKVSVRRLQDPELISRAYCNPIKYAKYLCGGGFDYENGKL